jgi:hypothetical protein
MFSASASVIPIRITRPPTSSSPRKLCGRRATLSLLLFTCLGILPLLAQAGQTGSGADEKKEEKKQDEELERLKREKERAELERDIAKAKAERLRVELPKEETKPLEGKISVGDNLLLPGTVLAYASSSEIAKRLAQDIHAAQGEARTIIVYSESHFGSVAAYHSVLNQVVAIQRAYEDKLPKDEVERLQAVPAMLLAPELVTTVLKGVADLVALFRTEVEIKGVSVGVEEVAVIAELARAFRENNSGVSVIYTPAYLPAQFLSDPTKDSDLAQKLSVLYRTRRRAGEIIAVYEAKTQEQQKADPLRDRILALKALGEQTDKLSSYLSSIDEKSGLNPLTLLLKAEYLNKKLTESTSRVLLTKVHLGAGSNKTTRHLFRGSKLYHDGGAVITFLLFDSNGTIQFSQTYFCVTEYTKFDKPKKWNFIRNFLSQEEADKEKEAKKKQKEAGGHGDP